MVTEEQLAELERLANEATPGPWVASVSNDCHFVSSVTAGEIVAKVERWSDQIDASDAAFIAAARTAMPELVAEVRRLRDMDRGTALGDALLERDRLRAEVDDLSERLDKSAQEVVRRGQAIADLQDERDAAVKMRRNACLAVVIAQERIAELETERDRLRAEVAAMRPVVEAARLYVTDGDGADTALFNATRAALLAYDAALAGGKER